MSSLEGIRHSETVRHMEGARQSEGALPADTPVPENQDRPHDAEQGQRQARKTGMLFVLASGATAFLGSIAVACAAQTAAAEPIGPAEPPVTPTPLAVGKDDSLPAVVLLAAIAGACLGTVALSSRLRRR